MEAWRQDIAHTFRMLRRSPAFAVAAVLSLAIGIGANTAVFSVASALLLRPLPYPDADRIAILWQRSPGLSVPQDWLSTGQYLDIALGQNVFEQTAAAIGASFNLTGDGVPERVDGIRVTSSFFPLFGARAELGSVFAEEHDRPGAPRVVLLTHGFWQRRFGSDRSVIGKTIRLNGNPFTIAGVMSEQFVFDKDVMPAVNGIQRTDILLPLPLAPSARSNRNGEDYDVFAKLKPGITREQAQTAMDQIAARMKVEYPAMYPANGGLTISVVPLLDQVVGDLRLALYVLLAAVGLVLLIACVNVANLLLSRAIARTRELAIRVAVGASRARLVRQLMTESLVLSAAGAVVGLGLAIIGISVLGRFGTASIPRAGDIRIDGPVLAFTILTSLAAPLVFGLVPALRAAHVDANAMLRAGGHGTTAGSSMAAPWRLRRPLIVAEVALSLVVLVATGLLVRSYDRITKASPGFIPDGVVSFRVSLPGLRYKTPEAVSGFYDDLSRRLKSLPGVQSVGSNYQLPLSSVALAWEPIVVDGYVPKAPGDARIITSSAYVSPEYFKTMGISLVRGRDFTTADKRGTPDVVIVDDKFAARFWPDEDAIGKRIRQSADAPWRTVVGIVSNTREYQADAQPPITTYFPVEQFAIGSRFVVVRGATSLDSRGLLMSVSREIHAIDPDLPTYDVSTMTQRVTDSLARRRLSMLILTVFGAIALVLSAVGIYGIIAFWVGQRRREIGIRVALGAGRERILRMIGREVLVSVAIGLVVGLGIAFAATQLMAGLLFGIQTTDAITYIATPAALIAVAIAAALVPARRAIGIQPAVTLRED